MKIKTALISVYNKEGIVSFARKLRNLKIEILSTGGTAKSLKKAGIKIEDASIYTGFPEIMDGRVKSLHPKIHGGILALRNNKKHIEETKKHNIKLIDMVIIDLYPFEETLKKTNKEEEIIKMIDIGGPSMIRSAAKNYKYVTVISNPADYKLVLDEIKQYGNTTLETRKYLAEKAFSLTSRLDSAISYYLSGGIKFSFAAEKVADLRYGENPHQNGALYRFVNYPKNICAIVNAKKTQGKDMSFLNFYDADAALHMIKDFEKPTAVFIKHANPCGVSSAEKIEEAFLKGYEADTLSAFGVIIAVNRPINEKIAKIIREQKIYIEVIVAPSFSKSARDILSKRTNVRLLEVPDLKSFRSDFDIKKVSGGLLVQEQNIKTVKEINLKTVTRRKPSRNEIKDLLFAWRVVKHIKSNAIVFVKNETTVGIGAGQMSRVDSVYMAVYKSKGKRKGAVMASDAFFPFSDSIEAAAKKGITAVIQPGGSIRDNKVIEKANELNLAMVFTGVRAFKH